MNELSDFQKMGLVLFFGDATEYDDNEPPEPYMHKCSRCSQQTFYSQKPRNLPKEMWCMAYQCNIENERED